MSRSTFKNNDGQWCINGAGGKLTSDIRGNYWGRDITLLAEYENTGLSPADIRVLQKYHDLHTHEDAKASQHVLDLIEAEKAGCFSPFRVGEHVQHKQHNWMGTVEEIAINSNGIFLYVSSGGGSVYVRPEEVMRTNTKGGQNDGGSNH